MRRIAMDAIVILVIAVFERRPDLLGFRIMRCSCVTECPFRYLCIQRNVASLYLCLLHQRAESSNLVDTERGRTLKLNFENALNNLPEEEWERVANLLDEKKTNQKTCQLKCHLKKYLGIAQKVE